MGSRFKRLSQTKTKNELTYRGVPSLSGRNNTPNSTNGYILLNKPNSFGFTESSAPQNPNALNFVIFIFFFSSSSSEADSDMVTKKEYALTVLFQIHKEMLPILLFVLASAIFLRFLKLGAQEYSIPNCRRPDKSILGWFHGIDEIHLGAVLKSYLEKDYEVHHRHHRSSSDCEILHVRKLCFDGVTGALR